MKHRVWIRRNDRIKQRYWVGKKLKRNYGSQIVRQRIRKDLPTLSNEEFEDNKYSIELFSKPGVRVLPQSHRRKEVIRVFEKNPELYKEFREKKPIILFHAGEDESKTFPTENLITISDNDSLGGHIYDKKLGISRIVGLEPHLRHELRHLSDYHLMDPGKNFEFYKQLPRPFKESASKSAELVSVRKYQSPKRIIDESQKRFMEDVF